MKIEFEGRTWQLDLDDIGMGDGLTISDHTGLSLVGWEDSLSDLDSLAWLKSMQGLYYLLRSQNGEPVLIGSTDFAVLKLFAAFVNGVKAAQPAEAAPEDPTRPAGGNAAEPLPQPGPVSLAG